MSNANNASHDPAPKPPQVGESEDDCGAQRVQDRVGRRYDEALGESIRQQSGAATLRVIRPGHAYTMEYRGDRINVHIDDSDTITDIGCG
ncbi:I78 family peptidase inhibitor [Halomonas sp. LR3S48]|uniref:I78 family peptidase inhibitor n=1 Tax=Halomonadaceae TaxID=28256 RepID=UPI0021E4ABFE|nr:I78 family peptidase inhibitor [Halomonas sp. LR3S48]UYG03443.1 I78 family peptidase inhibitor [Halomonas sp. LR3S48]